MKINKIIIGLMIISVLIVSGCAPQKYQPQQSNQPTCREVQVPYTESQCAYALEIDEKDMVFLDNPILSNEDYECPNRQGRGIANYGNIGITWEVLNKNDILLSMRCDVVIRKYSQFTQELLDEKVLETIKVNIPSQDIASLRREVYLPKCYGTIKLVCEEIKNLPECQPVTKYRTETKCD